MSKSGCTGRRKRFGRNIAEAVLASGDRLVATGARSSPLKIGERVWRSGSHRSP